jgi:hypothetical protein
MIQLVEALVVGVTDDAGEPLENGTVTCYTAGTTTLQTMYQERALETPHPNPATLDAAGRLIAFVEDRVKLVISSAAGAVVRTIDNVGISDSDVAGASISGAAGVALAETDGQLDVQVDGSTITVEENELTIPDGAIGSDQLAADVAFNTVAAATSVAVGSGPVLTDIGPGLATAEKVYPGTSAGAAFAQGSSNRTLNVQTTGGGATLPIVTSPAPSSHGLVVIRGSVAGDGTIVRGEGFSVSKTGTGTYDITFTQAFAEAPVVVSCARASGATAVPNGEATTGVTISVWNTTDTPAKIDNTLQLAFVAIGQRGA